MSDRETNKAIVRSLIEAADRGDLARLAEVYADDYRDHAVDGSRGPGDKKATLEAFHQLLRAFPDVEHTIEHIVGEGDLVVVLIRATGTHRGTYRGVAPTGRRVTMETTAIYRLRGGRIVERWCSGASPVLNQLEATNEEPTDPAVRVLRTTDGAWVPHPSGGRFQEVALAMVSLTRFVLDPYADFPEHQHPSEQITWVLEGELTFDVEGVEYVIGAGDAIAIPADVPHRVTAGPVAVEAVDAWSPPPTHFEAGARSADGWDWQEPPRMPRLVRRPTVQ